MLPDGTADGNTDGNVDLRVQKTREKINKSFCALLLEKDYETISVTEICRRAHIQRKTFYTYYRSVDELLQEKLDMISRKYIERIKDYSVPEDISAINRTFYIFSNEQGELYEKIVCSSKFTSIGSKLLKNLVRKTWQEAYWFKNLHAYEQNILLSFIYSTGAGLYKQWVDDGKVIKLEDMILYAERLLEQGVKGFSKLVRKEYVSRHEHL